MKKIKIPIVTQSAVCELGVFWVPYYTPVKFEHVAFSVPTGTTKCD